MSIEKRSKDRRVLNLDGGKKNLSMKAEILLIVTYWRGGYRSFKVGEKNKCRIFDLMRCFFLDSVS